MKHRYNQAFGATESHYNFSMLKKFQAALIEKCGITPGSSLLAGVSGGPDSLCLLHLLHQSGYQPVVAHLDHQLRPESKDEAEFVRQVAGEMGLRFVCREMDVKSFSQECRLTIEEGARMARYQFLFHEAAEIGAQAVVVGHNADDQVETVLMHLLRGAGVGGLAGMSYRSLPNAWSGQIALIRPLLGMWRKNIWKYLNEHGIEPQMDLSNQDVNYSRNRLRRDLIPSLETYNPRVREAIWRMAEILRQDDEMLEHHIAAFWEAVVINGSKDLITFDYRALRDLPTSIQRRVLHRAFSQMLPEFSDVSFLTIDRAVDFLQGCLFNDQIELVKGLILVREAERLWLAPGAAVLPGSTWPDLGVSTTTHLPFPGECQICSGWLISAEELRMGEDIRKLAEENKDPYQAWLDSDQITPPLSIRSRLPGDRFQPLGMSEGSIKISDYMINLKLPRRLRKDWPLVLSGKTIAWLPGGQPAHEFRLTRQTTRIAHLKIEAVNREG